MELIIVAIITGAFGIAGIRMKANLERKHEAAMVELRQINGAVNHRLPGEPTLIQLAVTTHESIGQLKEKVEAHIGDSGAHHQAAGR